MEDIQPLSRLWTEFEQIAERLVQYLKTSEDEFCALIDTLDDCWNIAENVQAATARLSAVTGEEGGSEARALRDSLLDGCQLLRQALEQLQQAGSQLAPITEKTRGLLKISNRLDEELVPLKYVAFYFQLEASRLSPDDKAMVLTMHQELSQVLLRMRAAGESQEATVTEIVAKLSDAALGVERACSSYAKRAADSQLRMERDAERLLTQPLGLAEMLVEARSRGAEIAAGIREAVKALQGHDAIRQRMEHVLLAVAAAREGRGMESGHALVLQQRHARDVLHTIVDIGSRIERELHGVASAASHIANNSQGKAKGADQSLEFEKTVDRMGALGSELGVLLQEAGKLGGFMLERVGPVRALLSCKSCGMEDLSRAMKQLALNVLIGAEQMPYAQGLNVLGAWTSGASERVLALALDLNGQFAVLAAELSSQASGIEQSIADLDSGREAMAATGDHERLRNSRRASYEEVAQFGVAVASFRKQALDLKNQIEDLLGSLRFVDEGTVLLGELDSIFTALLALYPKLEMPLDLDSALSGYVTAEQHQVHAALFGGEVVSFARLSEAAAGEDYGDNVELF